MSDAPQNPIDFDEVMIKRVDEVDSRSRDTDERVRRMEKQIRRCCGNVPPPPRPSPAPADDGFSPVIIEAQDSYRRDSEITSKGRQRAIRDEFAREIRRSPWSQWVFLAMLIFGAAMMLWREYSAPSPAPAPNSPAIEAYPDLPLLTNSPKLTSPPAVNPEPSGATVTEEWRYRIEGETIQMGPGATTRDRAWAAQMELRGYLVLPWTPPAKEKPEEPATPEITAVAVKPSIPPQLIELIKAARDEAAAIKRAAYNVLPSERTRLDGLLEKLDQAYGLAAGNVESLPQSPPTGAK